MMVSLISQAGRPWEWLLFVQNPANVCVCGVLVVVFPPLINSLVGLYADVLSPGAEPVHSGHSSLRQTAAGEGEGAPGPKGHSIPICFWADSVGSARIS